MRRTIAGFETNGPPVTDRDRTRLIGVHPALVEAITDVLNEMEQWGHPMFIVEGVRTVERQAELYAQGRTTSGPIVTHADGVVKRSKHQPKADGLGHAVDCAFLAGNPFAETHPWEQYGKAVEQRGLEWGGRWISIMDKPHAQLRDQPV